MARRAVILNAAFDVEGPSLDAVDDAIVEAQSTVSQIAVREDRHGTRVESSRLDRIELERGVRFRIVWPPIGAVEL
jgi:hypothetical protein